jgi:hypothetical protein
MRAMGYAAVVIKRARAGLDNTLEPTPAARFFI